MDTPKHHAGRRHWSGRRPRSFIASEALSQAWWQVKDSNLRSVRDGFTVPRLQDRDQRKRLTHNDFRAYSPQIADDHRPQPDTPMGNVYYNDGRVLYLNRLPRQCTWVRQGHCQARETVRYTYFSDNRTTWLGCRDAGRPKCSVQFIGTKPNNILSAQRLECSIEQHSLGETPASDDLRQA